MENRLPEKLTLLRKHFGYSQGDIAKSLGVNVTEYIHWENGNTLPNIEQFKKIAELFHVSLDSLLDNTAPLILPDLSQLQDSVEIAFMNKAGMETEVIDVADNMLPVNGVVSGEETQVLPNVSPDEQTAQLEHSEVPKEETVKPKKTDAQKKKTTRIIIASVVGLVLLLLGLLLLLRNGGGSNASLSHEKRLAEGDKYTLFIQENGMVKVWGEFDNQDEFQDLIQVSAYETHAVGLKKDGTVISNSGDAIVKSWSDMQKIAAGNTHVVAINEDNEVECTGSSSACAVEDWEDIKYIYAGNEITVGITNGGVLKVAGDYVNQLNDKEGIKNVDISSTIIALVKVDGTVEAYNLADGSTVNASDLNSIEDVAVGKDFIAGLNRTGDVSIVTEDKDLQKAVKSWANISFIAADDNTLVAIDRSNNIHGAGENEYKQYGEVKEEEKEDDKKEAKQLDTVQNIIFDQSTTNVQIKWDAVKDANSYEITFNPAISTAIPRLVGTSVSVPTNAFEKDVEYTISIVAYPKDEEKFKESEPAYATFKYVPKTVQLDSPKNIQALTAAKSWNIVWDAVEHADYYMVSVDGGNAEKASSPILEYDVSDKGWGGGSQHSISVTACSDDEKYTESSPATVTLTYDVPVYQMDIKFTDQTTGKSVGSTTKSLAEGKYTAAEICEGEQLPEGYELAFADQEVEVKNNGQINILVKLIDSGEDDGG